MSLKFLIVEDDADNRFLLTKTLARCFPTAELIECHDVVSAAELVSTEKFDAVIAHKAWPAVGSELIEALRGANSEVPMVMVSGIDKAEEAARLGANRFLHYDQWLMIGKVVAELLDPSKVGESGLVIPEEPEPVTGGYVVRNYELKAPL